MHCQPTSVRERGAAHLLTPENPPTPVSWHHKHPSPSPSPCSAPWGGGKYTWLHVFWCPIGAPRLDTRKTNGMRVFSRPTDGAIELAPPGSLARERDKALGYFEANAHRMRYHHFRALGMYPSFNVRAANSRGWP